MLSKYFLVCFPGMLGVGADVFDRLVQDASHGCITDG